MTEREGGVEKATLEVARKEVARQEARPHTCTWLHLQAAPEQADSGSREGAGCSRVRLIKTSTSAIAPMSTWLQLVAVRQRPDDAAECGMSPHVVAREGKRRVERVGGGATCS